MQIVTSFVQRHRYNLTAVFLFTLLVLIINTASAATIVISNISPQGWGFLEETATATGSFVAGPGTPPKGSGSAQLETDSTQEGGILIGAQISGLLTSQTKLTHR